MERETKNYLKWWAIVALAVALSAMCGCVPYLYTSVEMVEMPNYFGETSCDMNGNPIIKIRKDTASYAYRYTLVHEHEHANRMRRYGCVQFLVKYQKDTAFGFNEEAHAYCAEARAMILHGVKALAAVEYASLHTQAHPRGRHLKIDSVRKILPCRQLRDLPDTLRLPP